MSTPPMASPPPAAAPPKGLSSNRSNRGKTPTAISSVQAATLARELFAAVEDGDEAGVGRALSSGADVNARRAPLCATWNGAPVTLGLTALMVAMRMGRDGVAKQLLAAEANPLLLDQFDKTAMMYALEHGHGDMPSLVAIIRRLTPTPKDLAPVDSWGLNLVMYAALAGSASIVELLLAADTSGESLAARVTDGKHKDIDLLTLSAKHGQGKVIEALLRSSVSRGLLKVSRQITSIGANLPAVAETPAGGSPVGRRAGGGEKEKAAPPSEQLKHAVQRGERGMSAALILACCTGHWIEELNEAVAHELDEPDANGYTPIMHALTHGQSAIARNLIAKGVACDEMVPPKEAGEAPQTLLMVAVQNVVSKPNTEESEREQALATIRDLVRAGAPTRLPSLHGQRFSKEELYAMMRSESHVIGAALCAAEAQIDSEQADFKYRTVRVMMAAAFREAPGGALCAFVALMFTMREHADRVHLSDNELATSLRAEAMELGATVGLFVKTLKDGERERLLRSVAGENFLRFAAESKCRKICFAPAITHHISLRWSGELMFALGSGEGVYQWGGRLPLTASQVRIFNRLPSPSTAFHRLPSPSIALHHFPRSPFPLTPLSPHRRPGCSPASLPSCGSPTCSSSPPSPSTLPSPTGAASTSTPSASTEWTLATRPVAPRASQATPPPCGCGGAPSCSSTCPCSNSSWRSSAPSACSPSSSTSRPASTSTTTRSASPTTPRST